jgi:NADH-quinone oxidoreductase subunit J
MAVSTVLFGIVALVVIITAVGMLFSRNAVYSALFLAMNFVTVGVLYLILGAPFIALVQVTVYAGSIMVLFLFVIMLLGAENLPAAGTKVVQRVIAGVLGFILLGEIGFMLLGKAGLSMLVSTPPEEFASPVAIGLTLFDQYGLLFLVTSIILLAATIGAILLSRGDTPKGKRLEE